MPLILVSGSISVAKSQEQKHMPEVPQSFDWGEKQGQTHMTFQQIQDLKWKKIDDKAYVRIAENHGIRADQKLKIVSVQKPQESNLSLHIFHCGNGYCFPFSSKNLSLSEADIGSTLLQLDAVEIGKSLHQNAGHSKELRFELYKSLPNSQSLKLVGSNRFMMSELIGKSYKIPFRPEEAYFIGFEIK